MIKDNSFQEVEIKRIVEGHTDPDTGEWIDESEELVATVIADIQPKSGQQRAYEVQTEYESDYIAFVDVNDIEYEEGYSEIRQDDIAIDESGKEYDVVFPANWQEHLEIELKAK